MLCEEGVAGGGDVEGAEGEEEVQGGGGVCVEGFWVEGYEVERFYTCVCQSEGDEKGVEDGDLPSMPKSWVPMMER